MSFLRWSNTLRLARRSLLERPLVMVVLFVTVVSIVSLCVLGIPLRSRNRFAFLRRSAPVKRLPQLAPEDEHIRAAKLQRDGEINSDFRREVVLGKSKNSRYVDPEDARKDSEQAKLGSRRLLREIFQRADTSSDGLLSQEELTTWIGAKIHEHLDQAVQENVIVFTTIDRDPRDAVVSWDEYHSYWLKQRGMSDMYITNHTELHKGLTRTVKETIMRDKAAWSEAARSDPDRLNIDEFLAFRHPESSHSTLLLMAQELIDKFDEDGDEILSEAEFSNVESLQDWGDADTDKEMEKRRKRAEAERRREFREVMDEDKNGLVDRTELLNYIDPRNPRHARQEADTLIALADENKDNHLSLEEIWRHSDVFIGSKMVDTARSFHDEF